MFLFDADGIGVVHNDNDAIFNCDPHSRISNAFIVSNGVYYIAVSGFDNDPLSPNGLIWNEAPMDRERAPDGPGAPGPLTSWTQTYGDARSYFIALSGCTFARDDAGGYELSVDMPQGLPGPHPIGWSGAASTAACCRFLQLITRGNCQTSNTAKVQ